MKESVIKKESQERDMEGKTWAIIAVTLSILIAVVSASIDTGQEKQKIEALQIRQEQNIQSLTNCQTKLATQDVALGKIQKDVEYITKAVDEIRIDVKEITHD